MSEDFRLFTATDYLINALIGFAVGIKATPLGAFAPVFAVLTTEDEVTCRSRCAYNFLW